MDTLTSPPQPVGLPNRPMAMPGFPGSLPLPMGMRPLQGIMGAANPMLGFQDQIEKKKEFARAVYVTGFEKSLTPAMLEEHFKIKPIFALKLPFSKYNENKGFAFVYYGSEDDAAFVKKKLDHSVILRSKIRVSRTVISENLSKMMFKLKTQGLSKYEITDIEARYFNEQTLEKEV